MVSFNRSKDTSVGIREGFKQLVYGQNRIIGVEVQLPTCENLAKFLENTGNTGLAAARVVEMPVSAVAASLLGFIFGCCTLFQSDNAVKVGASLGKGLGKLARTAAALVTLCLAAPVIGGIVLYQKHEQDKTA